MSILILIVKNENGLRILNCSELVNCILIVKLQSLN